MEEIIDELCPLRYQLNQDREIKQACIQPNQQKYTYSFSICQRDSTTCLPSYVTCFNQYLQNQTINSIVPNNRKKHQLDVYSL